MKLSVAGFIAVVLVSVAEANNVDTAWVNFRLEYGKQYRTVDEDYYRKATFIENYDKIVKHNEDYAQGLVKYSLRINKFADISNEEFKKMRKSNIIQYIADDPVPGIEIKQFVPDPSVPIPDQIDWREKGAVTPVKNEGKCDSGWAFTVAGALEAQYFNQSKKLVALSAQNLLDCVPGGSGCDDGGTAVEPAYAYIHKNDGIESEETYPYLGTKGICHYNGSNKITSIKGYQTILSGSEDHLKAAVATIGPVATAVDSSEFDFQFYGSGLYHNVRCFCGNDVSDLDQAVLVVGYGTDDYDDFFDDNGDYWLIKNSWGSSWGESGYIKMVRNEDNECGIATKASFPTIYEEKPNKTLVV